jgi:predicted dehydrogenase
VIGLGVGAQHAATYASIAGCEVAALCDLDGEKLAAVGEQHPGARLSTDAADVIGDPEIDVVSIASYDTDHFGQVRGALESGKHAFVEKPLCTTREEAVELRGLLADAGVELSSNLPLRLSPRFLELKDRVDRGALGSVYFMEADYVYGRLWKLTEGWRGDLDRYSVMLGGGIHMVDLIRWVTGREVVAVTGRGNRIATEGTKFRFDDFAVAILELDDGSLAKVTANFGSVHPHFHSVAAYGTEGTFLNGQETATFWGREGGEIRPEETSSAYPGVAKGALIESFVARIRGEGEALVTADEAFATMAVCLAVDEAIASGDRVPVESLAP